MTYIEGTQELKDFLNDKGVEFKESKEQSKGTMQIIESNNISGGYLVSKIDVKVKGKVHSIENKVKVEENNGKIVLGGKPIDELSYYMEKMLHPKYKNYLQLEEYLKMEEIIDGKQKEK